ncbi:MAG TPA: DUF3368 domain-containing protein [Rhodocyclaceae bacterium]|nr:DUF3368 domain-containing protein [Rhodocyclaceae bacterium]
MAGIVLSDASPLIALAQVDGLAWPRTLFGEVRIPPEVEAEVVGDRGFAGEQAIAAALAAGWLKVAGPVPPEPVLPDLDEGEAACIRLALAARQPALLLMDERAGRAIAQEHGLRVAGTAAVIGMARQRDLIPCAREVFARLHASDFRISAEVIATVLTRVGA